MKFLTGYLNIMKTILGTGTIVYPFLLNLNGLIPCIIMTGISCIFSILGLIFYAKLNDKKNLTMSTLTSSKKIRIFVNSVISVKCIAVTISYIVIIYEFVSVFCKNYNLKYAKFIFVSFFLITIPVCTIKRFSKLRFTSFLGISATFIMVLASLLRLFNSKPTGKIFFFKKFNFSEIGSYVFAFTCHQSIFSFQNESKLSFNKVKYVIISSMISAMVIYIIFGAVNVHLFKIEKKFFESLPKDKITLFMLICFPLTVIFAIPLQMNAALYHLEINNLKFRYIFVIFFHFMGVFIALSGISLSTIISLVGGTTSSFICFIISGFYFLCLGKNKILRACAYVTVIYGILIFLLTVYQNGKKILYNEFL